MTTTTTMTKTSIPNSPVLVRLMLPDDANPGGSVHGGTILQLMEQAGSIAATRYVVSLGSNENNNFQDGNSIKEKVMAVMVRLENMRFWQPLHVGQLASVSAEVAFTSAHSMLLQVTVSAEDFTDCAIKKQVTNTGDLWFVPMQSSKSDATGVSVVTVPPMIVPEEGTLAWKQYQAGLESYRTRKAAEEEENAGQAGVPACLQTTDCMCPKCRESYKPPSEDMRTPSDSIQNIHRVVLPSDTIGCSTASSNIAMAGFVMKEMDNCAGASAVRHARTNVVTVGIHHIEFSKYVSLGTICNVSSKVVFCSSKSMEVEVVATVTSMDSLQQNELKDQVVARGIFSFVSVNDKHQSVAVPPLRLDTPANKDSFFQGQQRYQAAKQARAGNISK